MKTVHLRILVLYAALCLLPLSAIAQRLTFTPPSIPEMSSETPNTSTSSIGNSEMGERPWIVAGKVKSLRGEPVAGARVEVMPTSGWAERGSGGLGFGEIVMDKNGSAEPRSLVTDLRGEFRTEYLLTLVPGKEFTIDLKVTKKGFLNAHSLVSFGGSGKTWVIPVTLREPEEDPELLPQADLVSGLAPRLNQLKASDGLSAAGEKDYERGVAAFLERKTPNRALPFFTKVIRRDTSCTRCRTMLALAELDSGDWDGAYRNLAEASNMILDDRSLGRPEPLLAMGVMRSWRRQPKEAAGYFLEALEYAPGDPLALRELGRTQLLVQNWAAANLYLSKAIAANAGPETRLLRAEALLEEGHSREANADMIHYLNGRDVKDMPMQVRQVWARIQDRMKVESTYTDANSNGHAPIDYLHRPPRDLKGLVPATDQGQLDYILSAVGKTVAKFFQNFPNTSSLEQVHQEKLGGNHKTHGTLDQKFQYLCLTPAEYREPHFDEYRVDSSGAQASPEGLRDGFMLTSGFTSASLLFHPSYQSQATFRYLGRQKVNGRDNYVIAFAQQPAKALFTGTFKSNEISLTTLSQGLAWVDTESYEITRLRTDLLMPLSEVNLERETTEIDFAPVHFNGVGEGFSVPERVTVTVDWNGKHLQNEHRYTDFKLFNVDVHDKPGMPKEIGETTDGAPLSPTPP